jgi:hypothetical protein
VVRLGRGERLTYTTDGTAPTPASWPVCGPILLTDTTTLRVSVVTASGTVGEQIHGTYTIVAPLTTARPVATPGGGVYAAPQTVSLASPTPQAVVRYTLDGSEPTNTSAAYAQPLRIAQNTVVRARAFGGRVSVRLGRITVSLPAVFPSGVMTARYEITGQQQVVATPVITPASGLYRQTLTATATVSTPGAELRYRTDGADPTLADPVLPALGLSIAASQTVTVAGFLSGWTSSPVTRATYALQVPEPTCSPTGGLAHEPVAVTMSIPDGATVRYTLDGSDPVETSPVTNGQLLIDRTTTLRLRAYRVGWSPSAVVTHAFMLQPIAPTLSLAAGSYVGAQSVLITSATAEAILRYTLDGSTPTAASPVATGPIVLPGSCQLRAIATRPDWTDSPVVSAVYSLQSLPPTIAPESATTSTPFLATITVPADAQVYYTMDGATPSSASALYTAPILIDRNATLQAIAVRTGWEPSAVASSAWSFQALAPTVDVASGTYTQPQTVTLVTATPDAAIRYTLDGSDPTVAATAQTAAGPIPVDRSLTLRAVTTKPGWHASIPLACTYTLQVAQPTIDLAAGTYGAEQQAHVATISPGATLRYTLDGSDPSSSPSALVVDGPLVIHRSATLTVIGERAGWTSSVPTTAAYVLAVGPVTASLPSGTYVGSTAITLACPTPGVAIHVSLDGTAPTALSPTVTGPIDLPASGVLQAIAMRDGWTASPVLTQTYQLQVPSPLVDIADGTFQAPFLVRASVALSGAAVRYALGGSQPDATSPVWPVDGLRIETGTVLTLIAMREGWTSSAPVTATYSFQAQPPTASLGAGPWTTEQDVTLAATEGGAVIRYTLDGTNPTESTALTAVGPIHLDRPLTLRAVSTVPGWQTSAPLEIAYLFQVADPVFSPATELATGSVEVIAVSTTPQAQVHVTVDGSEPTSAAQMPPLTLTRTTTLRARAFRSDWTPSAVVQKTWTVTPTVGFLTAQTELTVGGTPVSIPVRLSDATDHEVVLTVAGIDGTAAFGPDLRLETTQVRIPAGQTEGQILVQALAGAADRPTVQASLRLVESVGAVVGTDGALMSLVIPGVAGPPPTFTERRSPLWRLPKERFDAQRWATDAAYRTAYLAAEVPERVWETDPSSALRLTASTSTLSCRLGDEVVLSFSSLGMAPVTITGNGYSAYEGRHGVTRSAGFDGQSKLAHFNLYPQNVGVWQLVAASPDCNNVVRIRMEVLP